MESFLESTALTTSLFKAQIHGIYQKDNVNHSKWAVEQMILS